MKKPNENSRFSVRAQEETSLVLAFGAEAWSTASAEKRRALMPSDMAWPSTPSPRSTGYLKIRYFSDMRATGISLVTTSPVGLRTRSEERRVGKERSSQG